MKPSDFQKTVQCRFESCLKKVVRHVVKDYQKKLKRRQKVPPDKKTSWGKRETV